MCDIQNIMRLCTHKIHSTRIHQSWGIFIHTMWLSLNVRCERANNSNNPTESYCTRTHSANQVCIRIILFVHHEAQHRDKESSPSAPETADSRNHNSSQRARCFVHKYGFRLKLWRRIVLLVPFP